MSNERSQVQRERIENKWMNPKVEQDASFLAASMIIMILETKLEKFLEILSDW